MEKQIIALTILLLLISCQPKSDCFDGRVIVEEINAVVKYENWKEPIFIERDGKKYVACSYPDTLINNQNYNVILELLKTEPIEKWIGQPCEIKELVVQNNQKIESIEINQKTLFTGGGGKTEKEETITIGIYITRISDLEIEYEFTELLDWKKNRELKGKAMLQNTTNDKIETRNKEIESAFRFIDLENEIEILITKDFKINETRSRLIEKGESKVSGLMYNK
ncbi:MAG: hypothetical protein AB8F94_10855 [Saprospiraceae bacterium]